MPFAEMVKGVEAGSEEGKNAGGSEFREKTERREKSCVDQGRQSQ